MSDTTVGKRHGEGRGQDHMEFNQARLPIVGHVEVDIEAKERTRLKALAQRILRDDPSLPRTEPFGPLVSSGMAPGPLAVIEDHGAIQHVGPHADLLYGHRALALAGDGDCVILATAPNEAFADYYRDVLRLGRVTFLSPRPSPVPRQLSLRCADDPAIVGALASLARQQGCLTVAPYMGSGGAWRLAGAIAGASGTAISVAAPPPNLTQRVNDKIWFSILVGDVLGSAAAPPTFATYGPAGLVARMRRLARHHLTVAAKLPSSASGLGNVVMTGQEILKTPPAQLASQLMARLHLERGGEGFPVLACAWKHAILATPSVQTWIPDPGSGDPVIEGVFDQVLSGERGTFVGAAPTSLGEPWLQRLGREAMSIAIILQMLGYFGRCSFDAILVDGEDGSTQLNWIDCNGRWGGVSLPMTLVNRLTGDWIEHPFWVVETRAEFGRLRMFGEVLDLVGDDLYRPGHNKSGIVFLSPARLERGIGIDAIAFDRNLGAAQARAGRLVAQLSNGDH